MKYNISGIKIEINSNFDIAQDDTALRFKDDFEKADKEITIVSGDIKLTEKPIYEYKDRKIYKFGNNYKIIYYDPILNINQFLLEENGNCILSNECKEEAKSSVHIFNFIDLPHIFINHNRLMLHSSFIISNGRAILFSGRSGIGKSTQASLWEKYEGAEIINGDKSVIYFENGRLFASSLPNSGTSGICKNKTAEINSIIFLSQGKENKIEILSPFQSFSLLTQNVIYDKWRDGELDKVIEISGEICKKVKMYSYSCLPDETAVKTLKEVIG